MSDRTPQNASYDYLVAVATPENTSATDSVPDTPSQSPASPTPKDQSNTSVASTSSDEVDEIDRSNIITSGTTGQFLLHVHVTDRLQEYDESRGYLPEDAHLNPRTIEEIYEPVLGEDLNVRDYGIAFSSEGAHFEGICSICGEDLTSKAALRICCGHEFHEDCLRTLINGIQEYSCKCPDCRYRFCDRRRRRVPEPESEYESESESEDEDEDEEDFE